MFGVNNIFFRFKLRGGTNGNSYNPPITPSTTAIPRTFLRGNLCYEEFCAAFQINVTKMCRYTFRHVLIQQICLIVYLREHFMWNTQNFLFLLHTSVDCICVYLSAKDFSSERLRKHTLFFCILAKPCTLDSGAIHNTQ